MLVCEDSSEAVYFGATVWNRVKKNDARRQKIIFASSQRGHVNWGKKNCLELRRKKLQIYIVHTTAFSESLCLLKITNKDEHCT